MIIIVRHGELNITNRTEMKIVWCIKLNTHYIKEDEKMKNNIVKKFLTGVLTLGLGAALLTGCGSAAAPAASADNGAAASEKQIYRTLDEIRKAEK